MDDSNNFDSEDSKRDEFHSDELNANGLDNSNSDGHDGSRDMDLMMVNQGHPIIQKH